MNRKNIMLRACLRAAGIAAAMWLAAPVQAQVVVIVHPKSPLTTASSEQVSDLYLGRSTAIGSVSNVQLLDLSEGSPAREHFYSKLTGKSPTQVRAIWSRLAFSGKASPPKELGSSADVRKVVANSPEAIGYIEKSAVDGSVRVIHAVD